MLAMLLPAVACGEKTAPTVEPPPAAEPVATFEESPCPFDVPEGSLVECGFVVVPEDHNDPAGPTIRLAVAVFKNQSETRLPDPVMLLCGGPGQRCAADAPLLSLSLATLSTNRDLVIFDQRGVGLSEPALECPEFEQSVLDTLDEPDLEVALQAQFDAMIDCRDRLTSEGHNLSAYTNLQNAADVDAVRIALGYDQVNLFGGSYGSLLAQATMRDHPNGIRSAVLDSVVPLEGSILVDSSVTTANAIMRLLDACAGDEACNDAYPNLQDVLFAVIDRLNADPIPITAVNPVNGVSYNALLTGDAVQSNLVAVFYLTPLIQALPLAIYDVHNGDFGLMAQLTGIKLALLGQLSRGMEFSVLCTDDLIGRTSDEFVDIRDALPRQLWGQADPEAVVKYGPFSICENWPVEEADPSVKEPLVSDIPTLVLEGEFDPVTPPEYGQLVAGYLSNAYFFEFPGIGHDVNGVSECARSMTAQFLDDPTTVPDDACITAMSGVVFDLPREPVEVVLKPVAYQERGFSGLVPRGWTEALPLNYRRGLTALDPTTFVQDAVPVTADELFGALSSQLGFDPGLESVVTAELGSFVWNFYAFELHGNAVDLALAESSVRAYIVLLISEPGERDELHEKVFLPAVAALAPME